MPQVDLRIERVRDLLTSSGIDLPTFDVLEATDELATVALMQPQPRLAKSASGFRNLDHTLAVAKARRFLRVATDNAAALCVTSRLSSNS
jgi:hypothetical protein